jgi:hypothetical protein
MKKKLFDILKLAFLQLYFTPTYSLRELFIEKIQIKRLLSLILVALELQSPLKNQRQFEEKKKLSRALCPL